MSRRHPKPQEIVSKLRQVEVLVGQGMKQIDAIREIGIVEQTFYHWRKQYGGMGTDQEKELKRRPRGRVDEERLVADMIELARQYGRYGYRRIAVMLREAGWQVSDGRIERLWRREGLKVTRKQPKRGRLWLNDGSCIRLRPEYRDHVWSYDFVHHRTDDGKAFRTLNILDEYSRECLTIWVKRKLNSTDVIDVLTDLFILRDIPAFIRSDNGPEFIAKAARNWISAVGAKTAYITPGSP